jgi:hypothetical protein
VQLFSTSASVHVMIDEDSLRVSIFSFSFQIEVLSSQEIFLTLEVFLFSFKSNKVPSKSQMIANIDNELKFLFSKV